MVEDVHNPKLIILFPTLTLTDKNTDKGGSKLMVGDNRDRLVDCAEEFVKYTLGILRFTEVVSGLIPFAMERNTVSLRTVDLV